MMSQTHPSASSGCANWCDLQISTSTFSWLIAVGWWLPLPNGKGKWQWPTKENVVLITTTRNRAKQLARAWMRKGRSISPFGYYIATIIKSLILAMRQNQSIPKPNHNSLTQFDLWDDKNKVYQIWLEVSTPLKNISQLGWLFPLCGQINQIVGNSWHYCYSQSTLLFSMYIFPYDCSQYIQYIEKCSKTTNKNINIFGQILVLLKLGWRILPTIHANASWACGRSWLRES